MVSQTNIVPGLAAHDGDVGFGVGVHSKTQWKLWPNPIIRKNILYRGHDKADRDRVQIPLGGHIEYFSFNEFDMLLVE